MINSENFEKSDETLQTDKQHIVLQNLIRHVNIREQQVSELKVNVFVHTLLLVDW